MSRLTGGTGPYAVITWTMGKKPYRHNHEDPLDALLTAIDYLKRGRNVRLNDAAVAELDTASVDEVTGAARVAGTPVPAMAVRFAAPGART